MSSVEQHKHLQIPLKDISSATNNFSKEHYIGWGGFGNVYTGNSEKHGIVAIKRMNPDRNKNSQGDHQFKTEIALLSNYNHENIVCFHGYCDENGEKILVYKYESRGSLDRHLTSTDLNWTQRLQICLDAARGLTYLHHDVTPEHRIIHRDVKSANILLDENWNAKISDFGLSRRGQTGEASFVISNVCGTDGYVDPEYYQMGYLTPKSDVFSFGVVLFEVLCGRKAFRKVEGLFFFAWVQRHYKRQTLNENIFSHFFEQINPASLHTFSAIAYKCLSISEERPTMKEVVEQLQKALNYQLASRSNEYLDDDFAAHHIQLGSMASSSTSFYSALGSLSLSWNYDVFLSFRGEDTGKTFVDHLYRCLVEHGIHTYKDDTTLARGESIGPALLKAIQESRIAIIVFSENYAESSLCLDELACILKCKDEMGQIVLPVFYHVDPSDVRKQKRKYEEAFAKHELKNNNKVEYWRKALFDAGNLRGWVHKDTANGHESEVIKDIVGSVSNTLFPLSSYVNEDLVGMSIRLEELRSQLEVEVGGVRMIGIWGMGGGGKTTLASAIYAEISSKFDGCCFLENIRDKSSKCGLETLQEKVLSDVLKEKDIKVGRVEEGTHMMRSRLCHRNVLIVLDDVDHLDQLEMLAGSTNWFGKGSRIIITTRDKHLLNAHKVDVIYDNKLLDDDEAIKLFCKHAPQQVYMATKDYEALAKAVVSYAHGLPLALNVLGSFLCDKDANEWRMFLARLKDTPEDDVIGKLKISYDGLERVEKELFLDIACFHRGRYIEDLMMSMDACGFHPNIGIKVLIQKGLIIASKDMNDLRYSEGRFDMLDSIQEMGHYIVQGEHPNNPIKHSRVWREKDILSICSTNTANSDSIEALDLYTRKNCPQAFPHIVATMKNLRSVYWECYPQSLLPTNFQPTKLRCLILKGSSLIQLWEGYKNLPNLKLLDLTRSTNLIKTPDLGGLPCLERMILSHCSSLREVHPSTGCHEKLSFLDLDSCDMLEVFPSINGMPQLATFILSSCSRLLTFPNIQTNMDNLVDIRLRESGIKVLPSSIVQYCTNLVSLDLSHCNNLKRIEVDFSRLRNLKELHISGCTNLKTPAQNLFLLN